ncbi:DUF5615 family PIN-like protein [Geminocystis herdmanii]|uniref:DUF5615 family PIN-like protein n=1 Tax=Geminocystis herdmanii TaxID=669359 RepID=UPI000346E923|nr:DUF5615 family PIN-like protein [Geminocystis herdmanii]
MRFLVDECTGSGVAKWLRSLGYEVFSVFDEARGISDEQIIQKVWIENWILITNDKDFGEKIYKEKRSHKGVILLRLQDQRSLIKIEILEKLLRKYCNQLPDNYVVVSETKIRFARKPQDF